MPVVPVRTCTYPGISDLIKHLTKFAPKWADHAEPRGFALKVRGYDLQAGAGGPGGRYEGAADNSPGLVSSSSSRSRAAA